MQGNVIEWPEKTGAPTGYSYEINLSALFSLMHTTTITIDTVFYLRSNQNSGAYH